MRLPLISLIALAACSGQASHIPNPLLLPGQAVVTGLENGVYNKRRASVSRFVARNQSTLLKEAKDGGGPTLFEAMRIARIPAARHREVIHVLNADPALYSADAEALVVALMVHSR